MFQHRLLNVYPCNDTVELGVIESKFDVAYCRNWVDHVRLTQSEVSVRLLLLTFKST